MDAFMVSPYVRVEKVLPLGGAGVPGFCCEDPDGGVVGSTAPAGFGGAARFRQALAHSMSASLILNG
jgi:hypothetical protein